MPTRTEYQSITFHSPVRILAGRGPTDSIEAIDPIRLVRVTDTERDDLFIGGVELKVEVPWSNVSGAIRKAVDKEAKPAKSDA